jgi:integrase
MSSKKTNHAVAGARSTPALPGAAASASDDIQHVSRFSDAILIKLKSQAIRDRREIIKFEDNTGLGARVSPTNISWAGQLPLPDRTKHRWKVGSYPALTVELARRAVQAVAGDIARGVDPRQKKREEESRAKAEAEAAAKAAAEAAFTTRVLVDRWADALDRAGKSPSYIVKAKQRLTNHFPDLMERPASGTPIDAIEKAIEAACVKRKRGRRRFGGEQAARNAGASLRAAFRWAAKKRLIPANPFMAGVDLPKAVERDRVPTIEECRRTWDAAGRLQYPEQHFCKLLLLTGCRRGEIAGLRWDEIVEEADGGRVIVLPPGRTKAGVGRTKTGAGHHIALSPEALDVIEDARRYRIVGSPYVLTYSGGAAFHSFGRTRRRLDLEIGDPPIPDMVLHDLRRAIVSHLAERGFDPVLLDKLLGHAPRKLSAVARIYQRAEHRGERREALEAWSRLLTQPPADVVDIKRERKR